MPEPLAIWLNDRKVALVQKEQHNRLRLQYTEEALEAYDPGTPLLSLAFPLTRDRYPNAVTRAFLDGLLPEGEPRRAIAAGLDIPASDVFDLLAVLGKDCAGALVVQPDDQPPPTTATTHTAEPLTPDELAQLIANLRSAPLGIDRNVRLSLAGVQEKLLLTRLEDGAWGRPIDGTPSTHILKPEIEPIGNTVENEVFCMRVAQHLGLPVAHVDTVVVDDRPVLVVERYDRRVDPDGNVYRIHQEDLCQALKLPPERKYEQDGGPSFAAVARILTDYADPAAPQTLLRSLTLNVAIGNRDAHGKNYSLLHTDTGALGLAPLYDLLSTRLYPLDDKLAMYVDDVQKADRVTSDRIVNEADKWGMGRRGATRTVADVIERLPATITAAANESPSPPEELVTLVEERVERLQNSLGAAGQ